MPGDRDKSMVSRIPSRERMDAGDCGKSMGVWNLSDCDACLCPYTNRVQVSALDCALDDLLVLDRAQKTVRSGSLCPGADRFLGNTVGHGIARRHAVGGDVVEVDGWVADVVAEFLRSVRVLIPGVRGAIRIESESPSDTLSSPVSFTPNASAQHSMPVSLAVPSDEFEVLHDPQLTVSLAID